jgi:DNA polymerase-1
MDNAEACGTEKLTQWRDQPIPPTCAQCIDCAKRLKDAWIRTWPENEDYFRYINDCCENGMMVGEAHLRLWPYLRDFFAPGRLAPGEIMQHVSGRVRGNTDYCSAANGFFQGLLADLAKSALRRISRECYDHTVRVPELAHENGVKSAYAGGPSPLLGSRPIVFQHDEIILEHPESAAHDGATRVSEIMVDEMRHYCPDLAPACAAEPTLMRRWYKGASPTRDAAGRLIPWEPPVPKACS